MSWQRRPGFCPRHFPVGLEFIEQKRDIAFRVDLLSAHQEGVMFTRKQLAGGAIAVIVIVGLGLVVFFGPFNLIHRAHPAETSTGTPPTAAETVHVQIVNNSTTGGEYVPSQIRALAGERIVFTNASHTVHTVTDRNGRFNTGKIAVGGTASLIIRRPAVYSIYCMYHPLMRGTIRVLRGCALHGATCTGSSSHP
jgi:plastocyanin